MLLLKDFAIAGGLLLLAAHGPGEWSVDARRLRLTEPGEWLRSRGSYS
jgi:hypothetical protein